jgi:hypothetical protein
VQFGLDSVSELPNLNELEELSRAALGEEFEELVQPKLPGVTDAEPTEAVDAAPEPDASPDDAVSDRNE